jgi:hypothetical protein
MSDDRDYWRRYDYQRELRDRDFYREQDRRRDHEREDREYEYRRREEATDRGWKALRDGDTTGALYEFVGPGAAADHLAATSGRASTSMSTSTERVWTTHAFVTELAELIANVEPAPALVTFHAVRIDTQGDAVIVATDGEREERFWVRDPLLSGLSVLTFAPARTDRLIAAIVARRDASPPAHDDSLPHSIVEELGELAANVTAAGDGAAIHVRRIDDDGDAVVDVTRGSSTDTFWVKASLLRQLAGLADAPYGVLQLMRDLARQS